MTFPKKLERVASAKFTATASWIMDWEFPHSKGPILPGTCRFVWAVIPPKGPKPTFARFRRFRAEDRAFARLEQRQFAVTASKDQSKLVVDGGPTLKRAALLVPRHTSPLIARCSGWRSSCRRGRRPQTGDQQQDVGEHLSRHSDLSHLEGHVATVAHLNRNSGPPPMTLGNAAAARVRLIVWVSRIAGTRSSPTSVRWRGATAPGTAAAD